MSEKKLDGRIALITGASKGLGKAMAIALAGSGATVALVSRNLEQLNESGRAVQAAGGEARIFQADVSDEDQVRKLERDVAGAFGKVHILINNAGINLRKPGGMESRDRNVSDQRLPYVPFICAAHEGYRLRPRH